MTPTAPPEPLRVLVCGGREYSDYGAVRNALDAIALRRGIGTVIHGGAGGADTLAGRWAASNGIPAVVFRPNWARHGRGAGMRRNRDMLTRGKPDLVLAFPGGPGTANMVSIAARAGVRVIRGGA